jgi:hypothetical protein
MAQARARRKNDTRLRGGMKRVRNDAQKLVGDVKIHVRTDLPQEEKISNALHVLLRSEVPEGAPLAAYESVLGFIAMAWNISLLPGHQRSAVIQKFVASLSGLDDAMRREAIGYVEMLVARKEETFPHDQRTVVSYDVRFQGKNLHISAAALSAA